MEQNKSNVAMYHMKIRICRPKMTKKNIQCSLAGLVKMTELWARGWCGFDGVVGFGCHEFGEDDGATGLGTMRVSAS
jgi:hypothetical protein